MDLQTAPNIFLQVNAPGLGICMRIISLLGLQEFYLVVIPMILWCYDKTNGLRLLILISVSAAFNVMLKLLFPTPRPYWITTGSESFCFRTFVWYAFGRCPGLTYISGVYRDMV